MTDPNKHRGWVNFTSPKPGQFYFPVDSGRLLTVALSRARRRVVLMANLRLLLNHREIPADAVSRRLLDYFKKEGTVLGLEEFEEL